MRLGRYQATFEYCHQSLAISLRAGVKPEYARAYRILGEVHAAEPHRDWEKAEGHLTESLKAFEEAVWELFAGEVHLSRARVALLRNDGTARQWAETAREIFAKCCARPRLRDAEELLAATP